MPTPVILVNGAAPPPLGSESNGTFDLSATVNLSISNYTKFGSIHWVVESKPDGATAALGSADPSSPYTTTYGPLDVEGTYLLRAEGNGNGSSEYARIAITVLTKAGQIRIPALGEDTNWDTTNGWAKAYSKLAGFVDRGNGMTTVAMADANQTLAKSQYEKRTIKATGSITTTRNLILPLVEGASWFVINGTSSAYPIMAGGSTGTKVMVPAGTGKLIFTDGTNFFTAPDNSLSGFTGLASSPAGQPGRILIDATSVVPLYADDGTEWRPILGGSMGYVPPVVSQWTWVNQENATATDRGWTVEMTTTNTSTGMNCIVKSTPSAPYTITAGFRIAHVGADGDSMRFGMVLRESSSGKLITLHINTDPTGIVALQVIKWTNPTTLASLFLSAAMLGQGFDFIWLRIVDDNTDRHYQYSFDGRNFATLGTEGRTAHMTANQVGACIYDALGNYPLVTLCSWKES